MSDPIIVCSQEPKPTYFDPSTCEALSNEWFQDIYLDPSTYGECILEITQILKSVGIIQVPLETSLEIHIFPRLGLVHVYQCSGVPIESTETIKAPVLEVVNRHGITGTTYVAISQ